VRHPHLDAVECVEPTRLLDQLGDAEVVVLVDAARSDDPPGSTRVLDVSQLPDLPGRSESSHGLSVRDVLALAQATGRAPRTLRLVAVTGASFAVGDPPSAMVRAATGRAADLAVALLRAPS
jgi:hydrogenase maturation protease